MGFGHVITTNYATDATMMTPRCPADSTARQWVRHRAAIRIQVAVGRDVLGEAQCHADRGGTESVVEPGLGLQQPGDQRSDEGTEIDTEVKQGDATVAARIALFLKGAQQ